MQGYFRCTYAFNYIPLYERVYLFIWIELNICSYCCWHNRFIVFLFIRTFKRVQFFRVCSRASHNSIIILSAIWWCSRLLAPENAAIYSARLHNESVLQKKKRNYMDYGFKNEMFAHLLYVEHRWQKMKKRTVAIYHIVSAM